MIFPFADYWHLYLAFSALVLVIVLLDLGVFHKQAHTVSMREASLWTVIWIAFAGVFSVGLWFYTNSVLGDPALAKQITLEFVTGYLVEKSLAIDNIFVFVMIFSALAIPSSLQHRVLIYGILGALIFRAICIAGASQLMQYHLLVIIFGVILIVSGIKMALVKEKENSLMESRTMRFIKRFVPFTDSFHGEKFITTENGRRVATPLLVALLFIEVSDIIFAVDSIPAIFAITKEPFIVFTSNMLAILGLRSMYFLLANVVDRFALLKYGLAAVLVFVGAKMVWLNELYDGKFPITLSLGIIAGLISTSIVASLIVSSPKRQNGKS